MSDSCPVLSDGEKQIVKLIDDADRALAHEVAIALERAASEVAKALKALGQEEAAPPMQYFAAVVHQQMYCLMCGADPENFEGGDAKIAYEVIRNSQNIAKHYWSADIEPYPPQTRSE